jgi:hypothetical protein
MAEETTAIPLCNASDLVDSALAVPFDVVYSAVLPFVTTGMFMLT